VRPEDGGPQISLKQPIGTPPVRASTQAMPVGSISGTVRCWGDKARGIRVSSEASSRLRSCEAVLFMRNPANIPGREYSLFIRLKNRILRLAPEVVKYEDARITEPFGRPGESASNRKERLKIDRWNVSRLPSSATLIVL
jgi:hypothetical protein